MLIRSSARRAISASVALPSPLAVCPGRISPFARRLASTDAAVFDWQDPLGSRNLLTEDEIAIADTAERYCQERLLPRVLRKCACCVYP